MHTFFKSKILCCSQGDLRSQKTLNSRIICQVQEHNNMIGSTALLKCSAEKLCNIILNTHCSKHNGEILIRISAQRSLTHDLCSQLIMWKTVSGENRKLLSTNQGGQTINCRNTGIDVVTRILTGNRVQRQSVDVQADLRCDLTKTIDRLSNTVKGTSQDFRGKPDFHRMTTKTCMSVSKGHIICTLENLNYCFIFVYFNNTAKLFGTVIHTEGDDFLIGSVFNAFQNYKRAVYFTKA